ncbi:MAG: M20/M25/M40 family metallo-hydrolase [Acidobacteria bacterium]|nr:MAG: M20/M25/M40 family metallo-hydrolase [Acidobacteriota bacterium]REK08712.1 MAG: M20/M25/M40 family metallo-hydrolase [Acidobacteriota bacterium]
MNTDRRYRRDDGTDRSSVAAGGATRTTARRQASPLSLAGAALALAVATAATVSASEPVHWEASALIRAEGFERSEVMTVLRTLTDEIGSRLTGSPGMQRANEWTRDQLAEWGLIDARLEEWGPFGRGWSFDRASVHLLSPHAMPLHALPQAWTPGTEGPVRGTVKALRVSSEADLESMRGELAGKIVLLDEAREPGERDEAFARYDETELEEISRIDLDDLAESPGRSARLASFRKRLELRRALREFLRQEGVVAALEMSDRDNGIVRVTGGGSREPDEDPGVPTLVVAAEHYRLLHRLLDRDLPVEIEVDVRARFHDDQLMAYNTLADLPGSDLAHQVVVVGGHLDSWHAAGGSNDNAAGVAVAMEAMRILRATGLEPRRTIRIGLWSGEEQGLLGARAHVAQHYAERPQNEDPETRDLPRFLQPPQWPITYKPAWDDFQAYFNLDNGSGRIRGIYTQSNPALVPIFSAWLQPLRDLGADTVSNRDTGGTDHQAFDAYSLPGFQFIQDDLDYSSRTHHTELDHADHARAADLKQAAVVMATFAYHAAMRDELLPRKPKPRPDPEAQREAEQSEAETAARR